MKAKKFVVSTFITLIVIGLIAGGVYFFFFRDSGGENVNIPSNLGEATTAKVEKGDLEVNINVPGTSKIVNEQILKFNQAGTIVSASLKAGDEVKKGDVLASMDKKEAYNEIEQAKLDLDNERIKYKKLIEDSGENKKTLADKIDDFKLKIENAELALKELSTTQKKALYDKKVDIEKAKNDLEKLTNSTPTDKEELKRTLANKEKDLAEKIANKESDKKKLDDDINKEKKSLEQKIFNYYNDIDNAVLNIKSTNLNIENDLKTFNNILGVYSEGLEGKYYAIFSNKNAGVAIKAEMNFRLSSEKFNEMVKYTDKMLAEKEHTIADLIEVEKRYRDLYENMMTTSDYIAQGLKETVSVDMQGETSSYLSMAEGMREGYKSKMNASKTKINDLQNLDSPTIMTERSELAIKDLQKAYEDKLKAIDDLKIEVDKLKDSLSFDLNTKDINLEKAKKDYEEMVKGLPQFEREQKENYKNKENEIRDLKKDLEKAEKEFSETADGPNQSELLIAKNAVKQAELKLEKLNEKLSDYEIIAPFDGIIRKFEYKAGSKLTADDKETIVIENPNIIEISVNLDQVDIVKVKKDQEVRIKFDAFPGVVYKGELGDISGTPVEKYGGISYEIKVLLQKEGDEVIYSGMTANVEIVTDKKSGILLIPSTAIESNDKGETYVTVKSGAKKEKKIIEVGVTNGKKTEVLSRLKEGDEVVEINFDANRFKEDEFSGGYYGY